MQAPARYSTRCKLARRSSSSPIDWQPPEAARPQRRKEAHRAAGGPARPAVTPGLRTPARASFTRLIVTRGGLAEVHGQRNPARDG